MIKSLFARAALLAVFAQPLLASAGAPLVVEVNGVRSADGQVVVSLCHEGESFPGRCTKKLKAKAEQGTVRVTFDDLAPGKYAAAVFHDADGDGKLTFLKEGIGFSNNANLAFSAPQFEPSAFAVSGKTTVRLTLKYFN
ncbi:DUF2141 domain-containing protein [Massilia arenosa]|uniref:DUF2141 domain-containing protein n=1 Tax=Zemynaea arenosa TaxID=2561931 RepID=A0A4Y9S9X6_9BURK|nr:DUF2141 domain-containing protein [Massilia arenosa]TFW16935.1 DUF2141 domain-containing protein [Massilia arenosa]